MAETTTRLMTVEEYRQLPETEPFDYELRHGELVQVARPKAKHYKTQVQLLALLAPLAGTTGFVGIELAFRALPEYELRVADVAFVSQGRWARIDPEDNLHGAPDLVVEVLSPSNTAAELYDKEQLCLQNGCHEFWVLDSKRRQVKVSTPDGITRTYHEGEDIPLSLFPGQKLSVSAIFTE